MSEPKHTPGPWHIHDYGNGVQDITAREIDGLSCRPARVFGDALDEVYGPIAIANARLIAAAPNLLKALRSMLHRFNHLDVDPGKREAIEAGQAAIAKAELSSNS